MKKILIIKHGSLGDIIFSLQSMFSVKNKYIDSSIDILTEKKYVNFFLKSKIFDNIIIDDRKNFIFQTIILLFSLSKNKYELIIDLQNSQRTSFYNLFFRIFSRSKISSSRNFSHSRYKIPSQGSETVMEGLSNQLKLIDIKNIGDINYNWLKIDIIEKSKKPIALFLPGVSKAGIYKQWQPNKFAQIANYYEKKGFKICVLGTKEDLDSCLPIIENCKDVINEIDKSPPEVIYSYALMSSIIFSNDTGPGHIAALAKKNIVWLANDNDISKANLPKGKHIYKILDNSVKNISADRVINFIKENNL